jgi:hypothetical protein
VFRIRSGGGGPRGACAGRRPAAIAAAIAAVVSLAACESAPHRLAGGVRDEAARLVMQDVREGLDLYAADELAPAGQRFHAAAVGARGLGDAAMERRATEAECAAWLLARCLPELAECGARLEEALRRERRSDPAASAIAALGAVAGGRALPVLRLPPDVERLLASRERP